MPVDAPAWALAEFEAEDEAEDEEKKKDQSDSAARVQNELAVARLFVCKKLKQLKECIQASSQNQR